nr:HDOD domain-containing protein [Thiocystis violacea]
MRSEVGGLPPAPAAAVKLLSLTRDEGTEVAAISRLIETEPALAVKVLQIVNSAYYGFPRRIQSIHRAVTLLGLSTVRQAALQILFYEKMIRRGGKGAFDRLHFWQHSLLVAILGREMAERLGHPDPDALYAAGLLHDLGKVILESHGRVRYSDFLTASAHSLNSMRENERIYFGVTHDVVGAVICERWELPELVCRVQSLHHRDLIDVGLTTQQAQEVAIVALADFIAWTQGIGSVDRFNRPDLSPDVLKLIALDQIDLSDILERADAEITEIGTFYGLAFPPSPQLRANLVATALSLCQGASGDAAPPMSGQRASHVAPHRSLDPDDFIPLTLEALHRDFGIERLLMMRIDSKRRSLVATHVYPVIPGFATGAPLELTINALSGELVRCLRERRPVLIREPAGNGRVLAILGVAEAAAVPVMCNGRLMGVLWVGGRRNGGQFDLAPLPEVMSVAGELGIALERSLAFARERARAEIDALTQLNNRGAVDRFLTQSFQQVSQFGRRFAVGLIDIDHFKRFNDTFGHQAGDDVLRIVADTMRGLTRPSDFLGRYGGEEFLFVLVDARRRGALAFAERIRREIESRGLVLAERFPGQALTVSLGVAMWEDPNQGSDEVVAAADAALYRAKGTGRNRVVSAWSEHEPETDGIRVDT